MAEIRLRIAEAERRLPAVCLCCGDDAAVTKQKTVTWLPPWTFVVLLTAGPLIFGIVALCVTKRVKLQAPLCERHQYHWLWRTLVITFTLLLLIPIGVGTILLQAEADRAPAGHLIRDLGGIACIASIGYLVAWVIMLMILQHTAVRAKEITDRDLVLQGVSASFVDAMEEWDRERRERRQRAAADEDSDEERLPPSRAARDTGIVDRRRRIEREEDDD